MSGLPPPLSDRLSPVTQEQFAENYGSSLICTMVALVFYGLSVLQTYIYFLHYPDDRFGMKALVSVVWAVSTTHAILLCHTVYHYVVLSYSNPLLLIGGEWSVYTATAIGMLLCVTVQLFYAKMIYHLARPRWRWMLAGGLVVLITVQLGFGLAVAVLEFREWDLQNLSRIVDSTMVPMFMTRVTSDALTALCLCVLLRGVHSGFGKTDKLVHMLIIYAINRFLLTTIVVLAETILLLVRPNSIFAMVIDFVTPTLYVNSFLATLNSRNHLRSMSDGNSSYISSPQDLSKIRFTSQIPKPKPQRKLGIEVNRDSAASMNFALDTRLGGTTAGQPTELSAFSEDQKVVGNSFGGSTYGGSESIGSAV